MAYQLPGSYGHPSIKKSTWQKLKNIPGFQVSSNSKPVTDFLWLYSESHGTSPSMLLAALLTSTATCLGSKTRVQRWSHNKSFTTTTNIFLIGAAQAGSGKSPAYKEAIEKPLRFIEKQHNVKLLISNCTPSAMLNILDQNDGEGIITADEMFHTVNAILKRSTGADATYERANLLSTWSGGALSMDWATKEGICIEESAVSLGGLTQPDRLMELMTEICISSDGLLARMLLWCLPMNPPDPDLDMISEEQLEKHHSNLLSFGPLMQLIYDAARTGMCLVFTPEAERVLRDLVDRTTIAVTQECVTEQNPKRPPIHQRKKKGPLFSQSGTKFVDHVVKIAACMHVLYTAINACLRKEAGALQLSMEIPERTTKMAFRFVQHVQEQMQQLEDSIKAGYLVSRDEPSTPSQDAVETPRKSNEKDQTMQRVLYQNGPALHAETITCK